MQRSRAVLITAIVYALIGLVLAAGGIWLAALGGSIFYIVLGVGVLATAALLLMQRRSALWLFAIVLVGTLAWAVHEVRLDWWPLAARGDIIFPMALWLLTPVIVRALIRGEPMSYARATAPLWIGVVASAAVLVAALLSSYHDIYWILGGQAKEGGVAPLASYFDRIRHAFLIGEATDLFAGQLEGKLPYSRCGDLQSALDAAHLRAQRQGGGEAVVLLSPACASWDQWKSYEHRGDAFRAMARALPGARHLGKAA